MQNMSENVKENEYIIAFLGTKEKGMNTTDHFFGNFVFTGSPTHVCIFFKRMVGWYMFTSINGYWFFDELVLSADINYETT